jgi:uncharacterized membrane protein
MARNSAYLLNLGLKPISSLEDKKRKKKAKTVRDASKKARTVGSSSNLPVDVDVIEQVDMEIDAATTTTTSSAATTTTTTTLSPAATTTPTATTENSSEKPPNVTPNAPPKKPASAFALFMAAKRVEVVTRFPSATFGDIGRRIGAMWRALGKEDKTPYTLLASAKKAAYQKELKAHRKANPPLKPSHVTSPPPAILTERQVAKDPEEVREDKKWKKEEETHRNPLTSQLFATN